MKLAVIGSRGLTVHDLENYLPKEVTEIVSGGAKGIDACARAYAKANGIKLTEFLPEYEKYGRSAPLKRNIQIIDYADEVLAFWDGIVQRYELCDPNLPEKAEKNHGPPLGKTVIFSILYFNKINLPATKKEPLFAVVFDPTHS